MIRKCRHHKLGVNRKKMSENSLREKRNWSSLSTSSQQPILRFIVNIPNRSRSASYRFYLLLIQWHTLHTVAPYLYRLPSIFPLMSYFDFYILFMLIIVFNVMCHYSPHSLTTISYDDGVIWQFNKLNDL